MKPEIPRGSKNVSSATGRKVKGVILVNPVEGVLPLSISFVGQKIEYRIELVDAEKNEWFSVTISVDDKHDTTAFFHAEFPARHMVETRGIGWWSQTFHGMSRLKP